MATGEFTASVESKAFNKAFYIAFAIVQGCRKINFAKRLSKPLEAGYKLPDMGTTGDGLCFARCRNGPFPI